MPPVPPLALTSPHGLGVTTPQLRLQGVEGCDEFASSILRSLHSEAELEQPSDTAKHSQIPGLPP